MGIGAAFATILLVAGATTCRAASGAGRGLGLAVAVVGGVLLVLSLIPVIRCSDTRLMARNYARSRTWHWSEVRSIRTDSSTLSPLTRGMCFTHLVVTDERGVFPAVATKLLTSGQLERLLGYLEKQAREWGFLLDLRESRFPIPDEDLIYQGPDPRAVEAQLRIRQERVRNELEQLRQELSGNKTEPRRSDE